MLVNVNVAHIPVYATAVGDGVNVGVNVGVGVGVIPIIVHVVDAVKSP